MTQMLAQRPKLQSSTPFSKQLNKRVKAALAEAPSHQRVKLTNMAIVFTLSLGSYALILSSEPGPWSLLLCAFCGVAHTLLGFHIFHDAIHGSLFRSQRANRISSFIACSILGVSRKLWHFKHNVLHHQYTNIHKIDDDLETRESLRLCEQQEMRPHYRFQHYYAFFIYGMTSIEWVFIKDYKQYFSKQLNAYQRIPTFRTSDHIEFWASKLLYLAIYVVLPLMIFGPVYFLLGAVVFHFSHSLAMASIFQLAHVMSHTSSDSLENENINLDHSSIQLLNTVNFANDSKFISWLSGGLNFQIEHHLFPNIHHSYYPQIAKIVKETAREYNLPYHEIPSYYQALKDHLITLKKLGSSHVSPAS